jgi:hypothetical protein
MNTSNHRRFKRDRDCKFQWCGTMSGAVILWVGMVLIGVVLAKSPPPQAPVESGVRVQNAG